MHEFLLPDVGEGLDQAEIVTWLVAEGDTVVRDQPLVEILTDKSQTELPSPVAGTVTRLGFAEGDMAEVGQTLVELDTGDIAAAGTTAAAAPGHGDRSIGQADASAPTPVGQGSAPAHNGAGSGRVKAAPAVRKRALEAGIDLALVVGTGPGNRITQQDLDQALSAPHSAPAALAAPTPAVPAPAAAAISAQTVQSQPTASAPAPETGASSLGQMAVGRHPLRGIRRVTAQTMEHAWKVPHIHGSDELDATALQAGRRRIKEIHPERAAKLTPLSFFVMAVADALRRYPMVNASIDTAAGHIDVHPEINIGIAVATESGLIVPVIRNADRRGLLDLSDEVARLSTSARSGAVTTADLQGGTCTISNYGSMGGRFAAPIIRPPEAAIIGFGAIKDRPFVEGGELLVRPTIPITVGCDHRLIDGDLMTSFQEHVIAVLSDPVTLLAR